jgi:hypothetical protein
MDRTVILVEGESDKAALEALARRRALDLGANGITILVMNGATNIVRFVVEAADSDVEVAGLYDASERAHVVRALAEAGLTDGREPAALERLGFFMCDPDLEAELIAALGVERVIEVIGQRSDELRRFRKLQQMPEWRGRPPADQLRRWFGSGGSRKVRYASLLVDALDPARAPRPLRAVLEYALER